jgi:hypothetical protein
MTHRELRCSSLPSKRKRYSKPFGQSKEEKCQVQRFIVNMSMKSFIFNLVELLLCVRRSDKRNEQIERDRKRRESMRR